MNDPHDIIGHEVPAADGGDYGHRVLTYDADTKDYLVHQIRWSTGELIADAPHKIDQFKISYRYDLRRKRKVLSEITKMLNKIIENPPPPQTHCACGWVVTKCDADPLGVAGCDQRQKERRS